MRGLGDLPREAAKESAPLVEAASKATAAAGTTPSGKPWVQTKAGGRALKNAANAVTAEALGPVVQIRVDGVEAIHHAGTKKDPQRQIIPSGGDSIPAGVADALVAGSTKAFQRMTGGR
jgi:hypothetical protein